jgi:hypothetical protein
MGSGTDSDHTRDPKAKGDKKSQDDGHGAKAKQTSPAQADQMLANNRLTPPVPLDFGERITGSDATEQAQVPTNLGNVAAIAQFTVTGADFALDSSSSSTMTLSPVSAMSGDQYTDQLKSAPKIAFKPSRAGEQHGTLTIAVGWQDGHTETQTVTLRGRARALDQAAAKTENAADVADEQQTHKRLADEQTQEEAAVAADEKQAPIYEPKFDTAIRTASQAAGHLARRQRAGVDIIDHETKAYQKIVEAAPHSIWGDLLEIGLSMATAGIAAHVAKVLLPKLLGATVEKIEDVAIPGHPEMVTTEFIPHKFSEFTTDFVKEGIKQAGKKAIATVGHGDGGGDKQTQQHTPNDQQRSSNSEINFFAQQWSVLDKQEQNNEELVESHARFARPLLRTKQPQAAVAVMSKLEETFKESGEHAEQEQANQLAPQWATLISRFSLGSEKTNTADGKHEQDVTRTEALREHHGSGAPKPVDGVLDVYLSGDYTTPRLEGAKLHGVSQEIADRLGALPIANLPMPVRFILGPRDDKPIIITRDEAGRVRVSGTLHNYSSEENAVPYASNLIERFLAQPLSSTNVEIQSDDATGRR